MRKKRVREREQGTMEQNRTHLRLHASRVYEAFTAAVGDNCTCKAKISRKRGVSVHSRNRFCDVFRLSCEHRTTHLGNKLKKAKRKKEEMSPSRQQHHHWLQQQTQQWLQHLQQQLLQPQRQWLRQQPVPNGGNGHE